MRNANWRYCPSCVWASGILSICREGLRMHCRFLIPQFHYCGAGCFPLSMRESVSTEKHITPSSLWQSCSCVSPTAFLERYINCPILYSPTLPPPLTSTAFQMHNYRTAEELLEQMEDGLSLEYMTNKQYLIRTHALIDRRLGRIDIRDTLPWIFAYCTLLRSKGLVMYLALPSSHNPQSPDYTLISLSLHSQSSANIIPPDCKSCAYWSALFVVVSFTLPEKTVPTRRKAPARRNHTRVCSVALVAWVRKPFLQRHKIRKKYCSSFASSHASFNCPRCSLVFLGVILIPTSF